MPETQNQSLPIVNFRNTGSGMLKLFTTYSPPEHEPGTEYATKAEAEADD